MKAHRTRRGASRLLVLLILPFIALLFPPFYNAVDPRIIGVPFFYWFQLAWILVTSALTLVVYLAGPKDEQAGGTP